MANLLDCSNFVRRFTAVRELNQDFTREVSSWMSFVSCDGTSCALWGFPFQWSTFGKSRTWRASHQGVFASEFVSEIFASRTRGRGGTCGASHRDDSSSGSSGGPWWWRNSGSPGACIWRGDHLSIIIFRSLNLYWIILILKSLLEFKKLVSENFKLKVQLKLK